MQQLQQQQRQSLVKIRLEEVKSTLQLVICLLNSLCLLLVLWFTGSRGGSFARNSVHFNCCCCRRRRRWGYVSSKDGLRM